MVRCEYCKKSYKEWKQLSFHKFPRDPKTRQRWIENMGKTSWEAKEWHALCSEHFAENCLDFRDKLWRLRKGSVPTIFKDKENSSVSRFPEDKDLDSIKERQKVDVDNLTDPPARESNEDRDYSQKSYGKLPSTDLPIKLDEDKTCPTAGRTPLQCFHHDHIYPVTIESLEHRLETAVAKKASLMNDKKLLSLGKKRALKKLHKVQEIKSKEQRKVNRHFHDAFVEFLNISGS